MSLNTQGKPGNPTAAESDGQIFNLVTNNASSIQAAKEVRFSQGQSRGANPQNGGNLGDLQAQSKLAVSKQRKQQIREQMHSNNVKMLESKQTYNPYHLSSYKQMDSGTGDQSPGAKGACIGDLPMHEINYIGKQVGYGHLQGDKAAQGEDAKRIFQQKKATQGYASEIRKQLKRK